MSNQVSPTPTIPPLDVRIEMRTAHLEMIQSVVGRMASFCAGIKNFCVTITAGILAFYSQKPDDRIILFAIATITVFALLDARYLCLERTFRSLYDSVRQEPNDKITDFYIGPSFGPNHKTHAALFSWSVLWFYLPFTAAVIALYIVFKVYQ